MAAIPLHCNICPKKPNFSDVSHLLTHIASKGHLSNYYKIKVRSGSDQASRRLIEQYDQWYSDWNVEDLMSERMSQKDKRRTRNRPAGGAARSHPPPPPPPAPEIQQPAPRPARQRAAVSNLLDPRLSEQQFIKVEHSRTPTPTPQPGPLLRQRNTFPPRMQHYAWAHAGSRSTSHSYTNPDYETSSEYSEPSVRKPRYRFAPPEESCAVEDDPADTPATSMEDPMAVSESTKLKGVLWPGMDLFDSATPEMRRKRNQKKDSSVVEQLELNSTEVEATELIFTPQGSFKRQRRISSSVYEDEEESSPIARVDSPRPTARQAALRDVDPNASRRARQAHQPQPFLLHRGGRYDNDHGRQPHSHNYPTRKKRVIDVFHDDDQEVSFAHPAPFNLLTGGYHRHQASPSPAPAYLANKNYADLRNFDNKENTTAVYEQPAFDYPHHQHGYYNAYAYGLNHPPTAFQYEGSLYLNNAYNHHYHEMADDQRTITAPPSPSTT